MGIFGFKRPVARDASDETPVRIPGEPFSIAAIPVYNELPEMPDISAVTIPDLRELAAGYKVNVPPSCRTKQAIYDYISRSIGAQEV
jgi:hypothetical protein